MIEKPEGVLITIFVQPRSSKNMLAGIHGDTLKIKLTAPPVDNAANKMCIQFLSKLIDIPKSSIEIVSGQTSRTKQIWIKTGGDPELREKIKRLAV